MQQALSLSDTTVVYGRMTESLHGVSITVPAGGIVALLGGNGAGKTTTLRAISGLLPFVGGRISRGTITYFGQDIRGRAPHLLARAGLMHVREGRHIFADLTVEENLIAATFAMSGRPRHRARGFDDIYAFFPQLRERRRQMAGYLSGGEQQMLAIGRALVGEPRLMLLDEPSLGLAPLVVAEIFQTIGRINAERSVPILLVEQNATMALRYATYAYVLENGRIALEGQPRDLARNDAIRRFYLGIDRS